MGLDTIAILFRRLISEAAHPAQLLIELLLIGLAVNWCAGVLKGTRGTRLLRGVIVLLVVATLGVQLLASALNWGRLELLYRYFVIGLAFIALVAFQPELRRALIRAGDVRFLRRSAPRDKVIAALVEAAAFLSRNKYGALIAIQREVGLASWAEHGVQMNCDVSADLLKSIFYEKGPLHDLGVIIRGTQIVAANCQFPVAESGELDASLGSRHRAAVGLSQESDALVMIVSEETGTISLADRGDLTRYLSLDDLEGELGTRLDGHTPQSQRAGLLAGIGWTRFARRMLAVVPLTLLIWFLADRAGMVRDEDIRVEVRIQPEANLDAGLSSPEGGVFRLVVRGPNRALDALRSSDGEPVRLLWRLKEPFDQPNEYVYQDDALVQLLQQIVDERAPAATVERVFPNSIKFAVDRLKRVRAKVALQTGALRVGNVVIDPPEVDVVLREGQVQRLPDGELQIAADLTPQLADVSAGQTRTFPRVVLSPQINGVTPRSLEPAEVAVTLTVEAQRITRRMERIPVELNLRPQVIEQVRLVPRDRNEWLLSFEVIGDRAKVEALTPAEVRAFVAVSPTEALPSPEYKPFEVKVLLPPGVELVGPAPTVQMLVTAIEDTTP